MSALTRPLWTAASVATATLLLSACGGSGNAASPTSAGSSTTQASAGLGAPQGGTRPPGVSGLVAAVDGRILQVQGTDTQTSVTWSSSTRFTREAAATAAAVVVGSCVIVRGAPATGTGATDPAAPVAAMSVAVSAAVGGECTGGFARGGAGRGGFAGGPTGALPDTTGPRPSDAPSGRFGPGPGVGGGRGAFGRVTAVTAAGFTVVSTVPVRAGGTATAGPTATTRTVTVTTSRATTYTVTVTATAKAAAVGTCVTAQGPSDDTGAVQATSIAVRPAVDGTCSQGFGRDQAAPTGGTHG